MVSIDVNNAQQLATLPSPLSDIGSKLSHIQHIIKSPAFSLKLSHELQDLHLRDLHTFQQHGINFNQAKVYFETQLPQRLQQCQTMLEVSKDFKTYAVHSSYEKDSKANVIPGVDLRSQVNFKGNKRPLKDAQETLKAVTSEASVLDQFLQEKGEGTEGSVARLNLKEEAMDGRIQLAEKMFPYQSKKPHHNSCIYLLNLYDAFVKQNSRPDAIEESIAHDKRPEAANALKAYQLLAFDLEPMRMRMVSGAFDLPQGPFIHK